MNLAWVRQSYFPDILSQVAPIATRGNSLDIAVLDDNGQRVWGHESGGAVLDPRVSAVVHRSIGQHGRARLDAGCQNVDHSHPPINQTPRWWVPRRAPTKHCSRPPRPR